jgi:hypothetical protein
VVHNARVETEMARSSAKRKAQIAWSRIEAIGGHGVWDTDVVIASLANTPVTDSDLALFRDFPFVQTLDLSHTSIGDDGLAHLYGLGMLEELIVVDTKITDEALRAFQEQNPSVKIITNPSPKGTVNPFTGKPF